MIFITFKTLFKTLWPLVLLVSLINLIIFNEYIYSEQFLPQKGIAGTSVLLFSIESFGWAIWLFWPKSSETLYRQLYSSPLKTQKIMLPVFILFSALTQLLPMLVYWQLEEVSNHPMLTDVLGFIWLWLYSFFGYGAGLVVSSSKRWHSGLLIFLIMSSIHFVEIAWQGSLLVFGLIFTWVSVYLAFRGVGKQLALAALYALIIGPVLVLCWQLTSLPQMKSAFVQFVDNNVESTRIEFLAGLDTSPTLVYTQWGVRTDWINYKLNIDGSNSPRYGSVWHENQADIEHIWRSRHAHEIPLHLSFRSGLNAFVFENAIYTESAEGKAHALWQAIDKSRHITWISRTRDDTRPEAHLLFGGDKFNIWLYESAEGNLIQSTFSIDGSPIIAHIEKEADSLYMQIIDDKEKRYAYRWNLTDNQLTKLYDAKSEHSLQESKQLMLLTSPVISILFGDIEIHSLNKSLKKWLVAGLVINFLIAIFTFFMFRRGESKASILTAMICNALLFGIPGLIALLICFDREQGMFIERTYPALTRKGGIVR